MHMQPHNQPPNCLDLCIQRAKLSCVWEQSIQVPKPSARDSSFHLSAFVAHFCLSTTTNYISPFWKQPRTHHRRRTEPFSTTRCGLLSSQGHHKEHADPQASNNKKPEVTAARLRPAASAEPCLFHEAPVPFGGSIWLADNPFLHVHPKPSREAISLPCYLCSWKRLVFLTRFPQRWKRRRMRVFRGITYLLQGLPLQVSRCEQRWKDRR